MLTKLTSRHQHTLSLANTEAFGSEGNFEIEARIFQHRLTPAGIRRADGARAKLTKLNIEPEDIAGAVKWARHAP